MVLGPRGAQAPQPGGYTVARRPEVNEPIELARNPSWRKRLANVRRAHVIADALTRERRRGRNEAIAFGIGLLVSASATAFLLSLLRC